MFVRFREAGRWLQISLVETRRVDGKVQYGHVAYLGSISTPPSIAERIVFWQNLHARLGKLANRVVDPGPIMASVHARIPMVTPDEQRALQLANTEADAAFWKGLEAVHQGMVDDHKGLIATAESAIAAGTDAASAAGNAAAAKERAERIRAGEDVPGGLGKPHTREDCERILREAGWTDADIRRAVRLAEIPEHVMQNLFKMLHAARSRAEDAALRHRRLVEARDESA